MTPEISRQLGEVGVFRKTAQDVLRFSMQKIRGKANDCKCFNGRASNLFLSFFATCDDMVQLLLSQSA